MVSKFLDVWAGGVYGVQVPPSPADAPAPRGKIPPCDGFSNLYCSTSPIARQRPRQTGGI